MHFLKMTQGLCKSRPSSQRDVETLEAALQARLVRAGPKRAIAKPLIIRRRAVRGDRSNFKLATPARGTISKPVLSAFGLIQLPSPPRHSPFPACSVRSTQRDSMHPFSVLTLGIFVAGYITARWDLVTRLYELAIFAWTYGVVVSKPHPSIALGIAPAACRPLVF